MKLVGNYHFKRALEIAKSGDHSIGVVGNKNLTMGLSDEYHKLFIMSNCPCGNFNDPIMSCSCDITELVNYRVNNLTYLNSKCEMVLEIVRPSWLEIVKEMDLKNKLDETCLSLLKIAVTKFGLYPSEIEKIIEVTNTITKMENKIKIECSHLAEALQYISIRK